MLPSPAKAPGPAQRNPAEGFGVWSFTQRVQVSLWYILIGYFGGLSVYHNDTWTLWVSYLRRGLDSPTSDKGGFGALRRS